MNEEVRILRRSLVRVLADLDVIASSQPTSLAAKNVTYHIERLLEWVDPMLLGWPEPVDAEDFPGY